MASPSFLRMACLKLSTSCCTSARAAARASAGASAAGENMGSEMENTKADSASFIDNSAKVSVVRDVPGTNQTHERRREASVA